MLLLLFALGVGLVAGWSRARAGVHARGIQVRHIWLVGAAAVLHATSSLATGDAAVLALGAAIGALLAFAIANPHVTGLVVAGVGLLLNLASLVLNNGVPVRPDALVAAGMVEREGLATYELEGPRHIETGADRVPVLGEVLPMGLIGEVMSFGDLIVVVGVADAARELARRRRHRWADDRRAGYAALTTLASADQDWGTAPSGAAVSATQCSAYPEREAPMTIDLDKEAAASGSADLVAANHSR